MKRTILAVALLFALTGPLLAAVAEDSPAGDPRIAKTLEELEILYEVDSDADYKILYEWEDDGRSQVAFINSATEKLDDLELREVWSVAYVSDKPLPVEIANRLLIDSYDKKLGAWQLLKTEDQYITVYAVKVDANADPKFLQLALEAALTSADEMEKELLGSDEF
jgi:hypothetical protein